MTRSLKIISLALLLTAVIASALAAAGAFGEEEEAEGGSYGELVASGYPAKLDGTDKEGAVNAFKLSGMTIVCPDSSYSGEIEGASPAFTIFPTYGKCTETVNNRNATVKMNGCGYKLTLRKTTIQGKTYVDNYFFTADIICTTGKEMEIVIYKAANDEKEQYCLFKIEEKPLVDRGKLQNVLEGGTTNGEFMLENKLENIVAAQSGECGSKTVTNGRLELGITFEGTTSVGGPNFLEVTDGE